MQDGDAGADVRERMGGVEGGGVCWDGDREIGGAEGVERAAGGLRNMLGVLQNRLRRLQEDGDREMGGAEGVERAAGGLHNMLGVLQNRLRRVQERVFRLQGRERGFFFLLFF
jgi:hypothetical protein